MPAARYCSSLLISKSLAPTGQVLKRLGTVLLIVGGLGVVVAAMAGGAVARAGLRPVGRLTEAAERVARTDDLRPIPVFGSDELARLTEAFNMMLRALAESRDRQARLVTDAGHELRTPLTSLRTNVELLMAAMAPGAPPLPEEEMAEHHVTVLNALHVVARNDDALINHLLQLATLKAREPDLSVPVEERPIGGLGIYLLRQLCDRMEYVREGGKNKLTLRKAKRV